VAVGVRSGPKDRGFLASVNSSCQLRWKVDGLAIGGPDWPDRTSGGGVRVVIRLVGCGRHACWRPRGVLEVAGIRQVTRTQGPGDAHAAADANTLLACLLHAEPAGPCPRASLWKSPHPPRRAMMCLHPPIARPRRWVVVRAVGERSRAGRRGRMWGLGLVDIPLPRRVGPVSACTPGRRSRPDR
jgi:hypothetical protein